MRFFEYPYVIITILVLCLLLAGLFGIYFLFKSLKAANGTEEKNFCSIDKIENNFERAGEIWKNRCLVYASVSLDNAIRLYSEPKAIRIMEQIREVMLAHFCIDTNGDIAICGKDNFLVVNNFDRDGVVHCIERCYAEIDKVFASHNAINIVGISFGYFCTCATDVSFKTALERAKQACSMAVDEETLHCGWDNVSGRAFEKKIKMENNIKNEILCNRFFLEYQPIMDAKNNTLVGAEVLSRLNSPTDGILSPHAFLSAVNNVGINREFDYYIFEKNCKWIANDKKKRTNYFYTINFSRYTLCDENFARKVIETLEKYELNFSCIAIEILEDKSLNEDEKEILIANLATLRKTGILFLLDDFGKGYTSFGELAELNVDIVKIDKEITQGATDKRGFVILSNIIRTAHDLGFKTLCEGIETEEQKNLVTEAGCDMLQGYYLYRPMPVTKLEALFEE